MIYALIDKLYSILDKSTVTMIILLLLLLSMQISQHRWDFR